MAKHRPGPYRDTSAPGAQYGHIVCDTPTGDEHSGHDEIAYYSGYLVAESVPETERPLLAAAPELLSALERAVAALRIAGMEHAQYAEVIAKAKGEA